MCNSCNCGYLIPMALTLNKILCLLEDANSVNPNDVANLLRMQARINPMTIAGEYPHVEDSRYIISTPVRFLDMLNTDLYLIYKTDSSSLGINLPLYFKDADYYGSTAAYEHAVVLPDGTPVLANQLMPNGIYPAKYLYTGGYIILDSLVPLNPNIIP